MALLYTLHTLQKKYAWQLAVAHVNYGLRAGDSNAEAHLVQDTAQKLGLPYYQLHKESLKQKSEEALRDIRYRFFEHLVKKQGFDFVALAHHQDDQAETVLLRLIRGSGSLGLSAMRPERGMYVRPFLSVSKESILDFLEQKRIPYRLDKSNQETKYLRNKIRHQLLPLLATYNPNIKQTLADTARVLQSEVSYFSSQITPFFITTKKRSLTFPLAGWQKLSREEQAALLRSGFQEKGLKMPTKRFLETLLQDLTLIPKKGLDKEYSRLKLRVNNDMIHIRFKEID